MGVERFYSRKNLREGEKIWKRIKTETQKAKTAYSGILRDLGRKFYSSILGLGKRSIRVKKIIEI
jgi:hypothetical protein